MSSESGVVGSLVLFFIGAVLYFLPTINGKSRKHPNTDSIFLLNLFLGWTLIGWVVALVWSASAMNKPAESKSSTTAPEIDRYEALEKLVSMKERGLFRKMSSRPKKQGCFEAEHQHNHYPLRRVFLCPEKNNEHQLRLPGHCC